MPNDLTTQRNSLNWRTDTRQPLENKGFFPRGGGVFIWTISGLTLAACSDIEDFLGLDDGGASGPVRFMPADEAARMAQEIALAPPENIDIMNWQLQVTATSTRMLEDGTESPIVSYGFVLDGDTTNPTQTHPDGFTIDNDGLITLASGTFDFEAQNSFTLIVQATDTPINADDEARTGRQTYTITVGNEDEGDSVYEIVGDVAVGETLEVRRISEDPDGEGAISVVWYRGTASTPTGTRGTTYLVTADDEGETIGAVISYIDGANEPESIDITASSVAFASGMGSRPIGVDEGTIATTTTLATVSATSELGEAITYAIGTASDHDNALFTVNSSGEISLNAAGTWDYESDKKQYVVEVIASASDGDSGMDTARARITFNVQNVDETGMRTYEIDAPATLEVGSVLTAQRVAGSDEDPDGVDENSIEYVWLADDVVIPGATSATYTIDGDDDLSAIYTVRVMYYDGYNAALPPADRTPTMIEASTSSVRFDATPPTITPPVDGANARTGDVVVTGISASGGDGMIEYSLENNFGRFQINPISGEVSVSEDFGGGTGGIWDFETTPSYELVIIATDVDDTNAGTTGTQDTDRLPVTVTLQDANEAPVVEGVQVTANDPLAMAGNPILAGLTGTTADEYIKGTAGADTIASGGGADHIMGGAGDDGITLSSARGSVETIYYRFSSAGSAAWAGSDGIDTITDFRRGEDRLIFIDTDGTPIDLMTFLSNDNVGSAGGQLAVVLKEDNDNIIQGIEIQFSATNKVVLNYHSDDYVEWWNGVSLTAIGPTYVGDGEAGINFDTTTRLRSLTDHAGLLPNYFGGTGNTNLQITSEDIFADVFISEKRTNADGAFASVITSDPDADTSPNGQIASYDITGGTGMDLFEISNDGGISVASTATFDYDATTSYTLEITATDMGDTPMTSPATTITIGLINDNNEAVYGINENEAGTMLTADLVTADPDGVHADSVTTYQWFTTTDLGVTTDTIATTGMNSITATTSQTLDISSHTLATNALYGVTITYTDGDGYKDSIDVRQSTIEFTTAAAQTITAGERSFTSGRDEDITVAMFATSIVGSGTASYAITGGTDMALFEIAGGNELYLLTSRDGAARTQNSFEVEITATDSVTMDTDVQTFTVTVTASSPAIIPDRQAFAHHDPMGPDDLGLTPMPDADPSAG